MNPIRRIRTLDFLIFQNSEANLGKIILDMPFFICRIVYKLFKTVLSNITILSDVKQSGLFLFSGEVNDRNKKTVKKEGEVDE